jgi:hypothetical protein
MKNLLKLLGVVLIAACFLVSCDQETKDILKKGGTLEITNGTGHINYYIIIEGEDLTKITQTLADLAEGDKGELINIDETKKITYDKVGVYTVVAANPVGFYETVILALGETKKVTIAAK